MELTYGANYMVTQICVVVQLFYLLMVFPPEDVFFSQAFNFHFQICCNNGQAIKLLTQVLKIALHSLPPSLLRFIPWSGERRQSLLIEIKLLLSSHTSSSKETAFAIIAFCVFLLFFLNGQSIREQERSQLLTLLSDPS